MLTTLQEFGIDRMTIAERISIAREILDSIAAEQPGASLTEAKRNELKRRLADEIANPDDEVSWEEVETAALARCAR